VLGTSSRVFIPDDAPDFPGWSGDHWFKKDSPFYRTYIVASSCEWAMTLAMQVFILSFVRCEHNHRGNYDNAELVAQRRATVNGRGVQFE
ncbi:hypothetical protein OESDEN_16299, partial [Oesophagostomum dentatum]